MLTTGSLSQAHVPVSSQCGISCTCQGHPVCTITAVCRQSNSSLTSSRKKEGVYTIHHYDMQLDRSERCRGRPAAVSCPADIRLSLINAVALGWPCPPPRVLQAARAVPRRVSRRLLILWGVCHPVGIRLPSDRRPFHTGALQWHTIHWCKYMYM